MNRKSHADYAGFTVSDLITDPYFQDWILHPDTEKDAFWNSFISTRPDKTVVIEKARALLQRIAFAEHMPTDEQVQQAWGRHLQMIDNSQGNNVFDIRNRPPALITWLKIAAVFGGLVLLAALWWLTADKKVMVRTYAGVRQQVWLPDSSTVVLNGNSAINYNNNWTRGKKREVWLEGEAFFEVRHLNRDPQQIKEEERFLVHTGHLLIEVLGTSFNIRERRGRTEVVLQTGKIKVWFPDSSHAPVTMQPGELVQYDARAHTLTTTTTVPENYSAWKEGKLILNDPTITAIITYLEDNYGKKIILQNKELATKKIEGPILLDNLNDALFILFTVLQV